MCKEDRRDDLALLYTLLGRIDRVAALRKAFLDHLKVRFASQVFGAQR